MSIVKNGLSALLVGAISLTAFAQQEVAKHTLDLRGSKWEAGDTVTFAVSTTGTENVEVAGPDGTPMMTQEETKNTEWEAVVKALEVDDEGRRTRCLVHFTSFKRTSEGVTNMGGQDQEKSSDDDSLTGVTIEVSGGKWTVVSPGGELTPIGQAFLETDFVKGHYVDDTHDMLAAQNAPEPVAVGGSWDADVQPFIAMVEYQAPIICDADKSSTKFTLEGVETKGDVEFATLKGEHTIALTQFEQQGVPMPFEENSTVKTTQTAVIANSGRLRPFETMNENTLSGTINMGQRVAVESSGTESTKMTIGGEIPEQKAESDATDGAEAPAEPETE